MHPSISVPTPRIAILSMLSSALLAIASETFGEDLRATKIKEDYREKVPVSGVIRRGIVAGDLGRLVETATMTVFLPRGPASQLCISIESRDGRYRGEFEVGVPIRTGVGMEARRVELPTDHLDKWQVRKAGEIAIDARLDTSCAREARGVPLLVSAWIAPASLPGVVTVLANTGDNEGRLLIPPAGQASPRTAVPCRSISGGVSVVAFNVECRVTVAGLDLAKTVLELSDGAYHRPPVPLNIAFGSGAS